MTAFLALVARDLKLAARGGSDMLTLVLFFIIVGALMPFAVGPDRGFLQRLAPGIVWIAAFLAMLLGLDRLFRADADDGSLLSFFGAALPLEAAIAAKLVAHWLTTALPLLAASPILAVLLGLDFSNWVRVLGALALGTPALAALGAIGAAVTVGLGRGGLLASVVIAPLALPVLIFGVGASVAPAGNEAALLLLSALSLVAVAFCPFAAAAALRVNAA